MDNEAIHRDDPNFGALLRRLRLDRGLTQEELAERAHLSVRGISDLERGVHPRARPETFALLVDALGLDPSELTHLDRLLHHSPARRPHDRVRLSTPSEHGNPLDLPRRHNLPFQLTSFVGRDHEVADLLTLSRDLNGPRLMTLTGAGGSGKSRLAVEVALRLDPSFVHGAYQVELGPVSDPSLIASAVASVLGVRETPGQPLVDRLVRFVGEKQLLLIADNCEHVVDEAARLIDLLVRGCPRLRIIATSRETLGIPGEQLYLVPPLQLPPPGDSLQDEPLASYDALRLFADRASTVDRHFRLTAENGPVVAEICRRLDGLPLAIELAAARLDTLSIEQIATGLESRFSLLTAGARTSPARHRTLWSLVRWSYDLISPSEQALFRLLSIFPGSFDLETAASVALGFSDMLGPKAVAARAVTETSLPFRPAELRPNPASLYAGLLDLLSSLVRKSLIVVERREVDVRYRLLETIREFGRQELGALGELDLAEKSLARWASALVSGAGTDWRSAGRREWARRLEVENGNLQAALTWCIRHNLDVALSLLATLLNFWSMTGRANLGRSWSARAIAVVAAQRQSGTAVHEWTAEARLNYARILRRAAVLEIPVDAVRARELASQSLRVFRQVNSLLGQAQAMSTLARLDQIAGRATDLQSYVDQVEEIVNQLTAAAHDEDAAEALSELSSIMLSRSDPAAAAACFERLLRVSASSGDSYLIAYAHAELVDICLALGDPRLGRHHGEKALAMARSLGDEDKVTWTLLSLGNAARLEHDFLYAKARLLEAIDMLRNIGHRPATARALAYLGNVAYHLGDDAGAAAALGEALSIARATRRPFPGWTIVLYHGLLEARRGEIERSVEHLIAAITHRDVSPTLLLTADRLDCEAALGVARKALRHDAYDRAVARGRQESLESILADLPYS
jgi:non-specific serine/threonine protein kinase